MYCKKKAHKEKKALKLLERNARKTAWKKKRTPQRQEVIVSFEDVEFESSSNRIMDYFFPLCELPENDVDHTEIVNFHFL